jgi:hypothetical protein
MYIMAPEPISNEKGRVKKVKLSHIFQDNRLTDGGEVVSLTRLPPFTPIKIPGIHFG